MTGGWFRVPNSIFSLGLQAGELATAALLLRYAGCDGRVFPSVGQIARDLNMSSNTVRTHLKSLESRALIRRIFRPMKSSQYVLSETLTLAPPSNFEAPANNGEGHGPDSGVSPSNFDAPPSSNFGKSPPQILKPKKRKEKKTNFFKKNSVEVSIKNLHGGDFGTQLSPGREKKALSELERIRLKNERERPEVYK